MASNAAHKINSPKEWPLRVCVAQSLGDIADLEKDWRNLETRANNNMSLFQSFDRNMNWCENWFTDNLIAGGNEQPFVVTVWQDHKLVSLWPQQSGVTGGIKTLSWLSSPALQYGDVLIDPDCHADEVCQTAWNNIIMSGVADLLHLGNVAATSPIYRFCHSIVLLLVIRNLQFWRLASLKIGRLTKQALKKTARRSRRKRYSKLARAGELVFKVHVTAVEFQYLVDVAINWKCQWLEKQNWPSALMGNEKFKAFLQSTQKANDQDNRRWVAGELSLDGKPIAIEIGAICGDRYISFLGAFDPDYANFSPGKIELEAMITWVHEQGIRYFDLLCVSTQYKSDWTDMPVPVENFTYACNLRGKILHSVWLKRLWPAFKYGLQHTPQEQRKMLATLFGKQIRRVHADKH